VGVLDASFHVRDGQVEKIMMSQMQPVFLAELDNINKLASGLGINPDQISSTGLPVQVVSTGMPQMIVPVKSLSAVRKLNAAEMDIPSLSKALDNVGTSFVLAFTTETMGPDVDVHCRGFGHLVGIPEDPATGSANGALGAYLVRYGVVPAADSSVNIVSEQGIEMKRPSTLHIEVDHDGGKPVAVRVGGQVVQVAQGVLRF
jgi:trans-2,3-dihydro-3-hydroxyanthranilate isomerase